MIMKCICVLTVLLSLPACTVSPSSTAGNETKQQVVTPVFKMIDIPSVLTATEERAEYLVLNYWNKFDFSDTTYLVSPAVLEQAFVDYLDVLPYSKPETAVASVKKTMEKAAVEKTMFVHFSGLFEKYLYEPNSPMRNEELFIPVLEVMTTSPVLDGTNKIDRVVISFEFYHSSF